MTDIFGIIPDAKPPKGKEGHVQDIFGTWYDPNPRVQPQPKQYKQPPRREPPRQKQRPQQPSQPKQRGYVTESYVQTGKDIVKGVKLGIRGAKYLNNLRKERNERRKTQPKTVTTETKTFNVSQDYPGTMKTKEFKIKQDY